MVYLKNKLLFYCAVSFLCTFLSFGFAEDCSEIKMQNLQIRHVEGDGIGYKKGYTTGEFFYSRAIDDSLFYFDNRAHVLNNGKWAASSGIGYRYRYDPLNRVFGVNLFGDFRNYTNTNFWQLGLGLETLGEIFHYRLNGYLPIAKPYKVHSIEFDRFEGNHAYVTSNINQAMWGIDGEIEAECYSYRDMDFSIAAGGYYYNGVKSKSAVGAKARATVTLYDAFHLRAISSYDHIFHFNLQGEIGLSFAFGKEKFPLQKRGKKCSRTRLCCEDQVAQNKRMVKLPYRNDLIVVSKAKKQDLALNPESGQPIYFSHVDNSSTKSLGTVESPYMSLAEASLAAKEGSSIFVHYGDGTSANMSDGIVLLDNQRLLGSGSSHPISTQLGNTTIPQISTYKPIITNINTPAGSYGVTLAKSGCEIAGLNISGARSSGIFGEDLLVAPTIRDNSICENGTGSGVHAGIEISMASGIVIDGTLEMSGNCITSSSGTDGLYIHPTAATLDGPAGIDVNIVDNNISGGDEDGIHVLRTGAVTGLFSLTGSINNNTFCGNNSEAIYFQHTTAAGEVFLDLSISNNIFAHNTYGMRFLRASGKMQVNNNVISNNATTGAFFNAGPFAEHLDIDVIGNRLFDNGGTNAFEVELDGSGTVYCELRNNINTPEGGTNRIFLDNNSGNTENFKVLLGPNDSPIQTDSVRVVR